MRKNFWLKYIILDEIEIEVKKVLKPLFNQKWRDAVQMSDDISSVFSNFYKNNPQYNEYLQYIDYIVNFIVVKSTDCIVFSIDEIIIKKILF